MRPEAALRKQIIRYRGMTGEERLNVAFRLHEMACDLTREGIRGQFPTATHEEVEQRLRARLLLAHHQ